MVEERKREDFFVLSDDAKSHCALRFWLGKREFNEYELGKLDKNGNPLIKLLQVSEGKFLKRGLICCLVGSKEEAERIIRFHLERKGNDG